MTPPIRLRVLVVDDDRISRIILRCMIESMGDVEVSEAEDGLDAWTKLDAGPAPELIFLDINMPRLNGVELLKRIRKDSRFSPVKVCFCSAVRDRQTVVEAVALQPDAYVLKPYSKPLIEAQVQKVRQFLSTEVSLEPVEAACRRLRIDQATYVRRVRELISESHAMSARFCTLVMQQDMAGAWLELDRAEKLAESLGARRTVNLVRKLSTHLSSVSQKEDAPTEQSWNLADASNRIMEGLQSLNAELQTLERICAGLAQDLPQPQANANDLPTPRPDPGTPVRPEGPTFS